MNKMFFAGEVYLLCASFLFHFGFLLYKINVFNLFYSRSSQRQIFSDKIDFTSIWD